MRFGDGQIRSDAMFSSPKLKIRFKSLPEFPDRYVIADLEGKFVDIAWATKKTKWLPGELRIGEGSSELLPILSDLLLAFRHDDNSVVIRGDFFAFESIEEETDFFEGLDILCSRSSFLRPGPDSSIVCQDLACLNKVLASWSSSFGYVNLFIYIMPTEHLDYLKQVIMADRGRYKRDHILKLGDHLRVVFEDISDGEKNAFALYSPSMSTDDMLTIIEDSISRHQYELEIYKL